MEDNLHQNLIELESELGKLKDTVKNVEKVEKSVLTAQEVISRNIEKIDKIDFQQKFENMFTNISLLQNKTDLFERNIKDELSKTKKEIMSSVQNDLLKFTNTFDELKKKQKTNMILSAIIILIGFSILIILAIN